jgi:polyferredoxin/formate hydrogenlyase subunit 6/NADH:ubiquinone oxidoreductase subunit I
VADRGRKARRSTGGWKAARRTRRAVQVAALVLFVFLLFAALQRREAASFADLFFRFDPLAAFGTMLSAREWLPRLAPAVVTVVVAIVVGRVWCGWICPLGTILEWSRFRMARGLGPHMPPRLRDVKYVLLGVIAVMAVFGSLTFMVLDPLALLTRTATTAVVPAFVYAVDFAEQALAGWGVGGEAIDWFESALRGRVLPYYQPHFAQAVALFLLFLGVVLLNLLADRFWCRYLCPLGALLGLLAKVQVLRPLVGEGCTDCGACVRSCRLDAVAPAAACAGAGHTGPAPDGPPPAPAARPAVVTSECTMCLDCFVACPEREAMTLGAALRPARWQDYDPGRRAFLTAAAAGVGAVALLGVGTWGGPTSARLIRPPGAQDEGAFLSRCLRCSECMKVCPTSGLQPALSEAGLEGLWTPVLASRSGYCDYGCTACGHVCPSGAIPRLALEEKRRQVLGVAVVDKDRCLPWAQDEPCIVCQEMCPVAPKAVALDRRRVVTQADGRQDYVQRPRVLADRCIGCGICEYRCPLEGPAAIVVMPAGPALAQGGTVGEGNRSAAATRA